MAVGTRQKIDKNVRGLTDIKQDCKLGIISSEICSTQRTRLTMLFSDILSNGITPRDRESWIKVMDKLLQIHENSRKTPSKHNLRYECHSICLALKRAIPELTLVHGCYLGLEITKKPEQFEYDVRNCRHSWLTTSDGAIIDPYPVGVLTVNPLIIGNSDYNLFGRAFYYEQPTVVREINYRKVWRQADLLFQLMR